MWNVKWPLSRPLPRKHAQHRHRHQWIGQCIFMPIILCFSWSGLRGRGSNCRCLLLPTHKFSASALGKIRFTLCCLTFHSKQSGSGSPFDVQTNGKLKAIKIIEMLYILFTVFNCGKFLLFYLIYAQFICISIFCLRPTDASWLQFYNICFIWPICWRFNSNAICQADKSTMKHWRAAHTAGGQAGAVA